MFNLEIRSLARGDIQEIVDYYDKVASSLADRFLDELFAGLELLQQQPELFQIKYRKTRVKYLKQFPFGIHYMIESKAVVILAIIHTRRDPKNWIQR